MSGLYERVLRQIERGAAAPSPQPPRSSASIVPWRRTAGALEVFWIRRSLALPFMAGFHAFPGGAVAKTDRVVEVGGSPQGIGAAAVDGAMPAAVLDGIELEPVAPTGLVAGALRELFEETGLLLAPRLGRRTELETRTERLASGRRALESRRIDLVELLQGLELQLDASRLVYAGRWLTPPLGPMRFDNRFFLLEWPAEEPQQPLVVPGEAELGEWIRPAAALARWRRGEVTTAPPILHILRVLDEDGPEAGLGRLREPREANVGPHRWIEFRPGVALFPVRTPTLPPAAFTNCYLLGLDEALLVDPGSPYDEEIESLAEALEAVRTLHGRRVSEIWLTHHHPDHVGAVETLRRRFEVPVAAHRETARRLVGSGISIDRELDDGERRILAGDPSFPVRVVHTPGHTRGHLCFLEETHGSLLVGDLIAGLGTIVIDPPEGNMEQYLDSLKKVGDLKPRALFPAHGPMTIDPRSKLEEYLEHRLWREDRILEAWRAGVRETAALRERVYKEVPPVAHPLAERQISAHLEHLEATGRLAEDVDADL